MVRAVVVDRGLQSGARGSRQIREELDIRGSDSPYRLCLGFKFEGGAAQKVIAFFRVIKISLALLDGLLAKGYSCLRCIFLQSQSHPTGGRQTFTSRLLHFTQFIAYPSQPFFPLIDVPPLRPTSHEYRV